MNNEKSEESKKKITMKEAMLRWLETRRLYIKKSTYTKYYHLINMHILPELGETDVEDVSQNVINGFISKKIHCGRLDNKGGLSSGYVGTLCYILGAVLNDVRRFEKIKKPSVRKKQVEYLTLKEQKKLEDYIIRNNDEKGIGILISLYTGMRIGEVCALKWQDIDFSEKTLHVNKTLVRAGDYSGNNGKTILYVDSVKTENSDRIIPVPIKLFELLNKYKRDDGFLIKGKKYPYVDTRTYQYHLKKTLKKCGLRNINYHALRHTFATRCIEAEMDMKTLSEILGHSKVHITMNTYVHSSINHKKIQMEKMMFFCEKNS